MKSFIFGFIVFIFFTSVFTSCKPVANDFIVFQTGITTPYIVLPNKPKGIEIKAQQLFVQHFKEITGINLKVISESAFKATEKQPAIFIGNTQASIQNKVNYTLQYDGFNIGQKGNNVFITSRQGLGILYGISTFFECYAQSSYIDNNEKMAIHQEIIKIPANTITAHEPAFNYRQAYFPQSLDYNYTIWNKIHLIDEYWAVWGHHLDKLVNTEGLTTEQINSIYAIQNSTITKDQYCFSSDILYSTLVKGIKLKMEQNPDLIYYSISPNDNSISCNCDRCNSINQHSTSSTNSLALLINKLATQFPNLVFTSHAYLSTLQPPTNIQYKPNVIILLSTIDFPKGQPLSDSKQASKFTELSINWQKACKNLYVWDYTIQYTNYYDFFPNLKALQKDLQFFKKLGIKGVLEQGSEDQYCLFGEWKSYAISKLLWNPTLNLDSLQYAFFEHAYPSQVDFITDFLTSLESSLRKTGKTLNLYGTIQQSLAAYMNNEQFDLFFYDLLEKYPQAKGNEQMRFQRVITALIYDKLEIMRSEGLGNFGFATLVGDSININPEIPKLLHQLSEFSSTSNVSQLNEVGDSISTYIHYWNTYIVSKSLKSKIINKPIHIITPSNGEYIGNAKQALNDGCIGFADYEVNWLVFNENSVEIEIPVSSYSTSTQISLSFLNDKRHSIFYPSNIELFSVAGGVKTKIDEKTISPSKENKSIQMINLSLKKQLKPEKLYILITSNIDLKRSDRKSSIACDELFIY